MALAGNHPRGWTGLGRCAIIVCMMGAGGGIARAQPAIQPPVAGRPADFSHVAGFFRIRASAEPTAVIVEDPLLLRVTITGQAVKPYFPKRSDLHLFPDDIHESFYVEPWPKEDRLEPAKSTWTFAWRLRPKTLEVKYIPSLKLVYWSPAQRAYQTTYADAVEIQVKPRPLATLPKEAMPLKKHPERIYRIVTDDRILENWDSEHWSGPWVWLALLGVPPLACWTWYRWWLRLHPDAVQERRKRRSRAAQEALEALQGEGAAADPAWMAGVVTEYLRRRLDFPAREATPGEVERHLSRAGVAKENRQQWTAFFQLCLAVRFAPRPNGTTIALCDEAVRLIQKLEAEAWT